MAVKILFDLPRETHRYFIEPISESLHLKTMICSRFLSFFHGLQKCDKTAVRLLSNACKSNVMTTLGKNLNNISQDCQCDITDLSKNYVKNNLTFANSPEEDIWKVPMLKNCKI